MKSRRQQQQQAPEPECPACLEGWTRERRASCYVYTRHAGEMIVHFPISGKWKAHKADGTDGIPCESAVEAAQNFPENSA